MSELGPTLTFREFFAQLAERLGAHLLPVRSEAHDIGSFLAPDGVHHPLDRQLARCIYRANRCGHLDAGICPQTTFRALGRFHRDLTRMPHTDVEQVALVEAVGEHLRALCQEHAHPLRAASPVAHLSSWRAVPAFRLIELRRV